MKKLKQLLTYRLESLILVAVLTNIRMTACGRNYSSKTLRKLISYIVQSVLAKSIYRDLENTRKIVKVTINSGKN
jgi:N-acetylglutamate synthase/N-acetylornithine aminotransferase